MKKERGIVEAKKVEEMIKEPEMVLFHVTI